MDAAAAILTSVSVGVLYLGAFIYATVRIIRTGELSELEKYAWVAAIIFLALVGALVWYIAGPRPFRQRHPRPMP